MSLELARSISMGPLVLLATVLSVLPNIVLCSDCGTDPVRHCGQDDSVCVDGRCVCPEGTIGNGYLGCYTSECETCFLVNDPILTTFRAERVDLPVPCRYHAMEYASIYVSEDEDKFSYITTVSGFNERIKGKIYVKGFDLIVQYTNNVDLSGEFSVRVKGSYVEGEYEFERAIRYPGSLIWEPFDSNSVEIAEMPFNERFVTASIDEENHRVVTIIPFVYLYIFFRPANPVLGKDQQFVPGISVAVTETDPTLMLWDGLDDHTMCMTPEGNNRPGVDAMAADLHLSRDNAFTFLAFLHTDNQTFPGSSPECEAVAKVVQACNDLTTREDAMDACAFIVQSPHFVNCWEYSGAGVNSDIILELFKVCMDAFCRQDVDECSSIRTQISEHSCARYAGPLLLEHDCSFGG